MSSENGTNTLPPVVGINFGNSYASIAVFTKEGNAECIANEDGERQIACALSFHGEQTYVGNQAQLQLVKNAENTITGFRNLLGKKYSEIPEPKNVIEHPDERDTPAYRIQDNMLTPFEANTLFLRLLIQSAQNFLGKEIQGTVISVPPTFTDVQKQALRKSAESAGIRVLQLLDEIAAAAIATNSPTEDATKLLIDFGSSSTTLAVLSIRQGLTHIVGSTTTTSASASLIDEKLLQFFATDFSKKNKIPLSLQDDHRARTKLSLAIQHTKRTISTSSLASCTIESLKDGYDYSGSINRTRFDMLLSPIYTSISQSILTLLSSSSLDALDIDEIIYVGGSASLSGLHSHLLDIFPENIKSNQGISDPTTIIARGCALQAALLRSLEQEKDLLNFFDTPAAVKTTSRTIGIFFPTASPSQPTLDLEPLLSSSSYVPLVLKDTPLPARRLISLQSSSNRITFEVWEVLEGIRVAKVIPSKPEVENGTANEDEDEEEVEELEETKHRTVTKSTLFGAFDIPTRKVQVEITIGVEGDIRVEVVGEGGVTKKLELSAPQAN